MKNYDYLEKLLEKKDHLIKKLTSLTDEQKQQAIAFFNKHPNYENEIDWNRKDLSWDDFDAVINKSRATKSQIKKAVKKGIEGLQEDEDYVYLGTFEYEGSDVDAYIPLNWKGSRVLASDQVPPLLSTEYDGYTGAKWCIAYQKTDQYWNSYTGKGDWFIFLLGEKVPTKKVAIQIPKDFISQKKAIEYYETLFGRTYPKLERMLVNAIVNSKDFLFLENESLDDLITSEVDKYRAEFKSIVLNFHKLIGFYKRSSQVTPSDKGYSFTSNVSFANFNISAWDSRDSNNRFNPFGDLEYSDRVNIDNSRVSYCAKEIFNNIINDNTLLEKIEDVLDKKLNIKNDTVYSLKASVMNQLSSVVEYFSSECIKNILWELYGSNIQDSIIEDFKKALDSFTIEGTNTIDFEKIYNFVGILGGNDSYYYYYKKTPQDVDFISLLSALCGIVLTKTKPLGYSTFTNFYKESNYSDRNGVELLLMNYLKESDLENPYTLAKEKSSDIKIIDLILGAIIDPVTHKFAYDFSQFEGKFRLYKDDVLNKNSSNKKYLLSSLEGCPRVCNSFFLSGFTLESGNLVGAPVEVETYFKVIEAGITSLKGAPLKVDTFEVIPEEGVTFNMSDLKGITFYRKIPLLETSFPYSSVDLGVTSNIVEFGVLNIPHNVPISGNGVLTNTYYRRYADDEIIPAYKTLSLNHYTGMVTQRTANLINKIGNNYEALLITIQSLSKSSTKNYHYKMSANDFFNILRWENFSQEAKPFITESIWSLYQLKEFLGLLPESLPIKVYVTNKYSEKTITSLKKQFDLWCKAHPTYTSKFGNIEVIPKRLYP